jgi:Ca-activated chloride channel family protein
VAPSFCLTPAALLLLSATLAAQAPLRVDVNLVLVPVTVTDRKGAVINGLDQSRFQIFEEGVPQAIASFSSEDLPASIGLVLDVSGSMRQKLGAAQTLVRALFAGADERDESFLLTCADRPDPQTNPARLQSARAGGWTALIDSIYAMVQRMRPARHSRQALIVVSDGIDNQSRYTKGELISRAIESDAQIFAVGLREPAGPRKAIELVEENRGLALLSDLARSTGGQYFQVDSADEVNGIAEKILLALHRQYVIGYYPTATQGNRVRRIQVKLDSPDLRLYGRSVYLAPAP